MINTNLLTARNILVIGLFALVWQIIMSRAHAYFHTDDAPASANADA